MGVKNPPNNIQGLVVLLVNGVVLYGGGMQEGLDYAMTIELFNDNLGTVTTLSLIHI